MKQDFLTLYNDGERLIPFVSHDIMELQRHYSSYKFFYDVIDCDVKSDLGNRTITILELGFGVGYGTKLLSKIPNSKITAIDISELCLKHATKYYNSDNINYKISDIAEFLENNIQSYDYVISRGVMEHVRDGINIMKKCKFSKRVMFDVPYNEKDDANSHHIVSYISEEHFKDFSNYELIYEDLKGEIFAFNQKPLRPNLIMCIMNADNLRKINDIFDFPIEPKLPPFAHTLYFLNSIKNANFKGRIDILKNTSISILRAIKRTGKKRWAS